VGDALIITNIPLTAVEDLQALVLSTRYKLHFVYKSPATTTSPVISKVDMAGNIPSAVSAKVSLGTSVILGAVAKEPVYVLIEAKSKR
jgi:hypothetical protein